ncbi:RDD family protein [Paenibacillus albiflavus]|uniref:RDD family protein n=1 Tax=Paenibacillus albiflavus TaxID=2545760 RepID=A0A4R4E514_9BACL|nr:RDD family protein [Paenibacillus albiflavus]TCZ74704.1 RDD family protein [Paenibacillus albiflavus]
MSKQVPITTRLLAFLWDYILISVYICFLVIIFIVARPLLIPLFTLNPLIAELSGFLLITLPVYLYFAISESTKLQGSWGKRKMGIAVANLNGNPLSLGKSLFRSTLKFIPWELAHFTIWHMAIPSNYPSYVIYTLLALVYGLAFIYLLSPFWSKQRQTLYDRIARTVVIYKK